MHAARHRSFRIRSLVALVAAAVVGFPSLAMADAALGAQRHPSALAAGIYESAPCAVDVPVAHRDRVTCGYLTVPERREEGADPERTVRLPVAVVPSRSSEPVADPLIVPTTGGLGRGTLWALDHFLDDAYWANADRDVILVEQRGETLAQPALDCPELAVDAFVRDGALLTGESADARRLQQVQRCHDRLVEDGIDLSAYTSAASAADIADLRAAMGIGAWNLYGVSYGSRLAMTIMRDHPDGLRAVILDGPYPPNVDRHELTPAGFDGAITALVADCDADAACHAAYPSLARTVADVLQRAASDPLSVTAQHPTDGSPVRIELTDDVLSTALFDAVSDSGMARALPFILERLTQGDADAALPLAQRALEAAPAAAGLGLSIECAEDIPFADDDRIVEAIAASEYGKHLPATATQRAQCEIWGVPAVAAAERAAVSSAVPTLITTGAYDPATPAAWAEAAASGLAAQTTVVFPHTGHGAVWATWADTCPAYVAAEFLADPTSPPDTSCTTRMDAPTFLTAGDVHATSSAYRFDRDVVRDRDPAQLAVGGMTLAVLAATVLYAIGYGLAWLVRRRGGAPEGAVLAAAVAAGANLAFAGGLSLVLLRADPLVLELGLPAAVWPLFILPFVALASTAVLVVLLVRAWAGGDGSFGDRIMLSLSAAGSLGFALWLLARGLLLL